MNGVVPFLVHISLPNTSFALFTSPPGRFRENPDLEKFQTDKDINEVTRPLGEDENRKRWGGGVKRKSALRRKQTLATCAFCCVGFLGMAQCRGNFGKASPVFKPCLWHTSKEKGYTAS